MSLAQIVESKALHDVIVERDNALALLDRALDKGVSVCVPCFHQSEYLGQALASVVTQTVPAFEVLVIDDGSEREEGARIEQISQEYGARYVRVTNRGLPGARNTGLMLAKGAAFLPLDADDWIEPTYIEKTLPLLIDADVVLTGLQEHGQRTGRYDPGFDRPWQQVDLALLRDDYNRFFYAALFRIKLLREIGGYNGRMINGWEDYDIWCDLLTRGVRLAAVNEPLLNYRTRPDSMLQETHRNWQEWNRKEMARHHGWEI